MSVYRGRLQVPTTASQAALLTQVSRVREQTLAVLERLTGSHVAGEVATDTLSALQKAAS